MQVKQAFTWIELLVVIAIICILIFLLIPVKSGSEEARCLDCRKRMQQIGMALRQYHDVYQTFPPSCTFDAEGNPLHSWRTLILPYLKLSYDQSDQVTYSKIRFDEPWNSKDNREIWDRWNYSFNCPNVFLSNGTIYKMIVGEKTAAGKSLSSFERKPSEVVLLIEAWPPVPWMSPTDFSTDDFSKAIYPNELDGLDLRNPEFLEKLNPDKKPVIGGLHPKEIHVLFADGTVKTYKNWKLPIKELETMCRTE